MIKDFKTLFAEQLVVEQEDERGETAFNSRSRLDRNAERDAFEDARDNDIDPEDFDDTEGLSINIEDEQAKLVMQYLEYVEEIEEMIDNLIDIRKTRKSGKEALLVTVANEDRLDSISRGLAGKLAGPLKKSADELAKVRNELLIISGRFPELQRRTTQI